MIKLTKKTDAFWAGNGFGNEAAEWVVKGAEHINVWSSGGNNWNVTNRDTGERILRNKYGRAFTLELLEDKMPELGS
jgi:hypothetical protein